MVDWWQTASKLRFRPCFGIKLKWFLTRSSGVCWTIDGDNSSAHSTLKNSLSLSRFVYDLISFFCSWWFLWGVGVYFKPFESNCISHAVRFLAERLNILGSVIVFVEDGLVTVWAMFEFLLKHGVWISRLDSVCLPLKIISYSSSDKWCLFIPVDSVRSKSPHLFWIMVKVSLLVGIILMVVHTFVSLWFLLVICCRQVIPEMFSFIHFCIALWCRI